MIDIGEWRFMNDITVTIDSREGTRIPYAKRFFDKYEPLVMELENGDYMFENCDTDEAVIFEYKTMKDFISSVNDSRIWEQVKRMNDEFKWSFIVIEGTIEDLRKINKNKMIKKNIGKPFSLSQYYGTIARLNCYTTVVQCHNQSQSFNFIENQVLKIFDDEPLIKHFKHDSDNSALNYLCGIKGVGYKTAELIISEFNVNSLIDLIDIAENVDLTLIDGIGTVTAGNIIKNIIGDE